MTYEYEPVKHDRRTAMRLVSVGVLTLGLSVMLASCRKRMPADGETDDDNSPSAGDGGY